MKTTRHTDPAEFLALVSPWLERQEALHGLLLSVAGRLTAPLKPEIQLWTVADEDGALALVAVQTPPYKMLLSQGSPQAAVALAEALAGRGDTLPGVIATPEVAEAFSRTWSALQGGTSSQGMGQGVYRLDQVTWPDPQAPGHMRPFVTRDRRLLADWLAAFMRDAHLNDPIVPLDAADGFIRRGAAFAWERDGQVVSMAAGTGATSQGRRVSMVYTPDALRGHGYASALVAALSQHLIDQGAGFCSLHTDLANPTSNAIYQRIGYHLVGHLHELVFT